MKACNLFLELLLTRVYPLPCCYAIVFHYAHSPMEWNICLIIKQTVNKPSLVTKKETERRIYPTTKTSIRSGIALAVPMQLFFPH